MFVVRTPLIEAIKAAKPEDFFSTTIRGLVGSFTKLNMLDLRVAAIMFSTKTGQNVKKAAKEQIDTYYDGSKGLFGARIVQVSQLPDDVFAIIPEEGFKPEFILFKIVPEDVYGFKVALQKAATQIQYLEDCLENFAMTGKFAKNWEGEPCQFKSEPEEPEPILPPKELEKE